MEEKTPNISERNFETAGERGTLTSAREPLGGGEKKKKRLNNGGKAKPFVER